jgi:putative sterol carrier protein
MANEFLSEEWIAQAETAVGSSETVKTVSTGLNCRVHVVVTDTPHGEVRYWYNVENGTVSMGVGDLDDADCTMAESYGTAVAIDKGELTIGAAFMQGKIEFGGSMEKAIKAMPLIAVAAAAMVAVDAQY